MDIRRLLPGIGQIVGERHVATGEYLYADFPVTEIRERHDRQHFRTCSVTNVRVWLRRIIGHLLVGQELYGVHEVAGLRVRYWG